MREGTAPAEALQCRRIPVAGERVSGRSDVLEGYNQWSEAHTMA